MNNQLINQSINQSINRLIDRSKWKYLYKVKPNTSNKRTKLKEITEKLKENRSAVMSS